MYRLYANDIEFGIDYPTLAAAKRIKLLYAKQFPRVTYYIRKMPGPSV